MTHHFSTNFCFCVATIWFCSLCACTKSVINNVQRSNVIFSKIYQFFNRFVLISSVLFYRNISRISFSFVLLQCFAGPFIELKLCSINNSDCWLHLPKGVVNALPELSSGHFLQSIEWLCLPAPWTNSSFYYVIASVCTDLETIHRRSLTFTMNLIAEVECSPHIWLEMHRVGTFWWPIRLDVEW